MYLNYKLRTVSGKLLLGKKLPHKQKLYLKDNFLLHRGGKGVTVTSWCYVIERVEIVEKCITSQYLSP